MNLTCGTSTGILAHPYIRRSGDDRGDDWDGDSARVYQHRRWHDRRGRFRKPVREQRRHFDTTDGLADRQRSFLSEESWAGQASWRLGRVHQLAGARDDKQRDRRQDEVNSLMPAAAPWSEWVPHAIDTIRDVGDRSVIESVRVRRPDHRERVFTSAFDGSKRFSIAAFPTERGQNPVCRSQSKNPGKLRWEIDPASGTNEWVIAGQARDWDRRGNGKFLSAPESMDPNELRGLVADWEPRWENAQEGRLAMAYDGKTGADGRESFLRTRKHDHVEVRRFGTFDRITVEDVPVGPATKEDARIWATAILVARSEADDAYVAPGDWRSGWSSAIEGTPLAEWAGEAPDPATLSEGNGRPLSVRTRWLLAAGADLEMEV